MIHWMELNVRTQLFLKQSCEQKKLSLVPSFKHVGHCNEPASFSHSTPIHFLDAGSSGAILKEICKKFIIWERGGGYLGFLEKDPSLMVQQQLYY